MKRTTTSRGKTPVPSRGSVRTRAIGAQKEALPKTPGETNRTGAGTHAPPIVSARTSSILERRNAGRFWRRGWLVRRMLMLADVGGLSLAFALAVALFRNRVGPTDPVAPQHEIQLFIATLPGWVLLARIHGLYDRDEERASHSTLDDLVGVFHLVTVGTFFFFAGAWVTGLAKPYPPKLLTFWVLAIIFVALARVGARAFARGRPPRGGRGGSRTRCAADDAGIV